MNIHLKHLPVNGGSGVKVRSTTLDHKEPQNRFKLDRRGSTLMYPSPIKLDMTGEKKKETRTIWVSPMSRTIIQSVEIASNIRTAANNLHTQACTIHKKLKPL